MPTAVINTRPSFSYDAEYHLGLVPDDPNKAGENVSRLNDAMEAMWHNGNFPFEHGTPGPILYPIQVAAKEFFFNDTLLGSWRMGGRLKGSGGRSYSFPSATYTNLDGGGGSVTRFTRLNGQDGGAIFRLRGSGFNLEGISFRGREYYSDTGGDGPDGAGAIPQGTIATPIGIEVEARGYPSSSQYVIRDCSIDDCTVGICLRAGYYDESGNFVDREDNGDTSYIQGLTTNRVGTIIRSENQQSMGWGLSDITVNGPEAILLDIQRGGHIAIDRLWVQCWNSFTMLQVRDFSPNNCRFTVRDFRWDHVPNPAGYFTIFKYTGPAKDNAYQVKWTVRIEGSMSNYYNVGSWWDATKLIVIPNDAVNFPLGDILLDIMGITENWGTGIPTDRFTRVGRWLVPTNAWQS